MEKKKRKKNAPVKPWQTIAAAVAAVALLAGVLYALTRVKPSNLREIEKVSYGIDVARYQGTIDWDETAEHVDFVMVRLGYRTLIDGAIQEDSNARYNMQEASRRNVAIGGYFFSTAVTVEEAVEEADWVAELIEGYPITYPIAYDCEGFSKSGNRHAHLTPRQRTDIALAFLERIEEHGYEGMFYGSKSDMTRGRWEMGRIEPEYKVWLAHYTEPADPETERSDYGDPYQMWQYTQRGTMAGIDGPVDLDVAWFGYEGIAMPRGEPSGETVGPDVEAMMEFESVWEHVTAKEETNLRDIPSQDDSARILTTLQNGEVIMRTGISDSGWSRCIYEGITCYALTSYLTTDLNPPETEPDDGIETEFHPVDQTVTAKEVVNLRSIPSVTDPESQIIGQLNHGDAARRTGISDNGWSRLQWNGQTCYAVSDYLERTDGETEPEEGIQTQFRSVDDLVTAKDAVNLRTIPSVTDPESIVVIKLKHGETVRRTGINEDVGWSRVEYNGQILYCVTSYLEIVEEKQ